jgi:hypothetical protein
MVGAATGPPSPASSRDDARRPRYVDAAPGELVAPVNIRPRVAVALFLTHDEMAQFVGAGKPLAVTAVI